MVEVYRKPIYEMTFSEKQPLNGVYKKSLKRNTTKHEKLFMALIDQTNYRAIFQKGFLKDYFCIVDFYIPKLKLVVEIDGEYHRNYEQIKKDERRDYYLSHVRGFRVLRFTNNDVENLTVDSLSQILSKFVTKK